MTLLLLLFCPFSSSSSQHVFDSSSCSSWQLLVNPQSPAIYVRQWWCRTASVVALSNIKLSRNATITKTNRWTVSEIVIIKVLTFIQSWHKRRIVLHLLICGFIFPHAIISDILHPRKSRRTLVISGPPGWWRWSEGVFLFVFFFC